jgi:hypothetical protein
LVRKLKEAAHKYGMEAEVHLLLDGLSNLKGRADESREQ